MYQLINFDCLRLIAKYIDVSDIQAFTIFIKIVGEPNIDYNTIINNRLNPDNIFNQLTDDVNDLTYQMRISNVILSGSRAVEFLYPGVCTEKSDWNFFCLNHICDKLTKQNRVLKHFIDQGMTIERCEVEENNAIIEDTIYDPYEVEICYGKISKRSKEHIVKFIKPTTTTIMGNILNFLCTASQCFVTGFAAVSMYHNLSKNRKMIVWDTTKDHKRNTIFQRNATCSVHAPLQNIGGNTASLESVLDRLRKEYEQLIKSSKEIAIANNEVRLKLLSHLPPTINEDLFDIILRRIIGTCTCIPTNTIDIEINKYTQANYDIISFAEYKELEPDIIDKGYKVRYIGDNGCYIHTFGKYINFSNNELQLHKYLQNLSHILWYEYDCASIQILESWKIANSLGWEENKITPGYI